MSENHPGRFTRRSFTRRVIGLAGVGVAGSILAACAGTPATPTAEPAAPTAAAAAPSPTTAGQPTAAAAATPTGAAKPTAAPAAAATPTIATQPATSSGTEVVKWVTYASPSANKWQNEYAVAEYKKVQPKVEVNWVAIPYAEFNAKIFAMQAAGDTPNMFGFDIFATWYARGLAYPIDDYLSTEKGLADQYFKNMFDTYKWQGKRWGLPMAPRFGTMTFYNKDLFDQAGVPYPKIDYTLKEWNVDVMLEKAQKLTKNYGKPDVVFGIDFNPWSPHGLAYLWGGDTYTKEMYDNGIADKTTVDSQASRDAHQFKQDLIQKHKVHAAAGDQQTISVLGDPFKTGRVAMTVQGGWAWGSFSDITAFKWAAAPAPGKTDTKVSENLNIWMLGSGQRGRDATWEFMKFVTNKESMTAWVQMTGAQPARPDVLDEWVKKHSSHMPEADIKTLVNENIKHTVESMDHMVVDYYRFDDPYTQGVSAVWDGKTTVNDFLTGLKTTWDTTALDIYNQYKDKLPK